MEHQDPLIDILSEINKVTSVSLKHKLFALNNLNDQKNKIEDEGYQVEYHDLKHQFEIKYQDIYAEIAKLVKGESTPELSQEDLTKYGLEAGVSSTGPIPEFWGKAIRNSKYFVCNDKDEQILKHLSDVSIVLDGKLNFTVKFQFEENDFFSPNVLTKTFTYDEKTFELAETKATSITWSSAEKNPKMSKKNKKIKKGKKTETKIVEEVVPCFFDFFQDETGDMLASSKDEAEFIKDELVPFSMEFYLDIQKDDEFDDEDGEEEDDEDEDEDDKPKGKKKTPKPDAKNEKCKNQ